MQRSIKLEDEEMNFEENPIDSKDRIAAHQNEVYFGITGVKEEINETLDYNNISEIKEYCNGEDKPILKSERKEKNYYSSMNCSSLIDMKKELDDTNNLLFEDYRNDDTKSNTEFVHDTLGAIWIKEDKEFVMDNEPCNHINMEMEDCEDHLHAAEVEDGELKHVYCKYCDNYVLCESLRLHLNNWHKDEYISQIMERNFHCKFCGNDVFCSTLVKHLETHHKEENEIQKILLYPMESKERKHAISAFRNNTDINQFITADKRPYRMMNEEECLISSEKKKEKKMLSCFQSVSKCDVEHGNIISSLNIKNQVFRLMKPDLISLEAMTDILIAHVGEYYLNNHRCAQNEHITHTVISKMRELSCLLMAYRTLVKDEKLSFIDIIDPNNFSKSVKAVKILAGYDNVKKRFKCPSLARSVYDSLKLVCTVLVCLILKKNLHKITKSLSDQIKWIKKVELFKEMIETQWNVELMYPDNIEPPANDQKKFSLLNLAIQLKQFQEEVLRIAYQCQKELFTNSESRESYQLLVQATLALIYLSNKRNVTQIQFMKIEHYQDDNDVCVRDFEHILTHVEKILTTKYRKVLVPKQAGEKVLILIPYVIQCFVNILLKHRDKHVDIDNKYIFAMPGSNIKWGESDVAIRSLCENMNLKEESIGSDKFRKYTATIMGILNLSQGELQQFGHFMGCALETNQFYELPISAYQTAKLSKLLQVMEEGPILSKYMGKCLAEIDIDPNAEFADDDNDESEDINSLTINEYVVDGIEACIDISSQKDIDKDKKETYMFKKEQQNENTTPNENCEIDQYFSKKDFRISVISFEKLVELCDKPWHRNEIYNGIGKVAKIKHKVDNNGSKRGWTNNEIALIVKDFGCFIQSGVYPPGSEMKKFLLKNNITKTVPVLRSKIQYLIGVKNKL